MTKLEALELAVRSLLDVVQETALAIGEPDWADVVRDTFTLHREQISDPGRFSIQEPHRRTSPNS